MDKLIINARERPYSPDIADLQAIAGRTFSEFMRYKYSEGFNANDLQHFQNVVYGLTVTSQPATATTEVVITPGVLMQFSSSLAPVPGTLDSGYRIGINRGYVHVDLPTPGSATWYTLEAQVTEVVGASEQRDIMNVTTGRFESQLVTKRSDWTCGTAIGTGLAWRTGTAASIPVPTGGDWVTLAAFLVQPGGTIAVAADAVDLRPVAKLRTSESEQGWSRSARVPVLRTVSTPAVFASFFVRLAVEKATSNADASADVGGGLDLSVSDSTSVLNSFNPQGPAVIEPATTVAASTWYYLYLCPFFNVAPEQQRQGPAHTRGVLVLSVNPPDAEGLFNSVAVVLPAPFNNYTVPANQAPCVGALRSNSLANGWTPMGGGNGEYVLAGTPGLAAELAGGTTNPLPLPSTLYPAHARSRGWLVRTR